MPTGPPTLLDAIALIDGEDPGRAWWLLKQLDGAQRLVQTEIVATLAGALFQLDELKQGLNGKRDKQYVEQASELRNSVARSLEMLCSFPGRVKLQVSTKRLSPQEAMDAAADAPPDQGGNGQDGPADTTSPESSNGEE